MFQAVLNKEGETKPFTTLPKTTKYLLVLVPEAGSIKIIVLSYTLELLSGREKLFA